MAEERPQPSEPVAPASPVVNAGGIFLALAALYFGRDIFVPVCAGDPPGLCPCPTGRLAAPLQGSTHCRRAAGRHVRRADHRRRVAGGRRSADRARIERSELQGNNIDKAPFAPFRRPRLGRNRAGHPHGRGPVARALQRRPRGEGRASHPRHPRNAPSAARCRWSSSSRNCAPSKSSSTIVGPLIAALVTAGMVIVFVIFVLIERTDLRDRFIRLVSHGDMQTSTRVLDDAAERVSRYLLMQLVVNICYGLPVAIGLYLIGVPNALLWGLLATVLRFIPYLGPFLATLFPAVLAFATDPGWTMLLRGDRTVRGHRAHHRQCGRALALRLEHRPFFPGHHSRCGVLDDLVGSSWAVSRHPAHRLSRGDRPLRAAIGVSRRSPRLRPGAGAGGAVLSATSGRQCRRGDRSGRDRNRRDLAR